MKHIIFSMILFIGMQNLYSQYENNNYNVYLLWEVVYNLHEVMLGEPDSTLVAKNGALVTCKWLKAGECNIDWLSSIELNLIFINQPAIVSIKWVEKEFQTGNKEDVFAINKLDVEDYLPPEIEYFDETGELIEVFRHKKNSGMMFSITKYKGKYKCYSIIYFPLIYNIDAYPPEFTI